MRPPSTRNRTQKPPVIHPRPETAQRAEIILRNVHKRPETIIDPKSGSLARVCACVHETASPTHVALPHARACAIGGRRELVIWRSMCTRAYARKGAREARSFRD